MEFNDYYLILGVSKEATKEEIKKAYHKLVKIYHPDKSQSEVSEEEIKELEEKVKIINEAYSVLKDDKARQEYNYEYDHYYESLKQQEQEYDYDSYNSYAEYNRDHRDYRDTYYDDYKEPQHTGRTRKRYKQKQRPRVIVLASDFVDYIRNINQEIKDEEVYTIGQRHKKINRRMNRKHRKHIDTIPKDIAFHAAKGSIHVCYEMLYQLSKLGSIKEDSIPKYILRNKTVLGTVVAIVIASNLMATNVEQSALDDTSNETVITTDDISDKENLHQTITLYKIHEVKSGDTLSGLSYDANIAMDTLKGLNKLNSNNIQIGQELGIPYIINREDLQYYTMSIDTEGKSIYDIAKEYNTTAATIAKLNEEKIEIVADTYVILDKENNTLIVPKFISQEELKEIKNKETTKTY